ncbi:hypothetical protein FWK35_00007194 [Aphis craccivora]|uniref:Uncharacterized protein n=1 Tax=Aphis craccivora TaxID=307492 RepID=A0A6G0Z8U0_APHCR|nr:hypothetical protein FWK35_00007194 [Aphis craccivora]
MLNLKIFRSNLKRNYQKSSILNSDYFLNSEIIENRLILVFNSVILCDNQEITFLGYRDYGDYAKEIIDYPAKKPRKL